MNKRNNKRVGNAGINQDGERCLGRALCGNIGDVLVIILNRNTLIST